MRKEYTILKSSFVLEFFSAIDDFFSNFPSLYTLIDSQIDRRVYHNIDEDLDLIFYNVATKYQPSQQKIILIVTTEYAPEEEIWYQKDIICSGKDDNTTNDGSVKNAAYYFPVPTLKEGEKLVCNYNVENNTFMFTVIRNCDFAYEVDLTTVMRTESIFFGTVIKYLSFPGGFFYGGDFVNTYERFYRQNGDDGVFCIYDDSFKNINFHKQPPPIGFKGDWSYPWCDNPYQQFDCACRNPMNFPEPNRVNRFSAILKIEVDNAPNRRKNAEVDITDIIDNNPTIKKITRKNIWATTMELEFYVRMVCSITNSTVELPRYEPLIAQTTIERGHTVNTLNNITTIMPLWFMVQRDPAILNEYSGVCKNEVINFVDMFNMSSDRMDNDTFGINDGHIYNCFQMGNRRSMYGMKGYSGIAFKQEQNNLLLLDLDEMEKHIAPDETTPLLNITVGHNLCYGGNTAFTDMTEGSFILKHPYTAYSSIVFEFCSKDKKTTGTVTWTKAKLDSALNDSDVFNLLTVGGLTILGDVSGAWWIKPFSAGSTSITFLCVSKNCILTGIKGII